MNDDQFERLIAKLDSIETGEKLIFWVLSAIVGLLFAIALKS